MSLSGAISGHSTENLLSPATADAAQHDPLIPIVQQAQQQLMNFAGSENALAELSSIFKSAKVASLEAVLENWVMGNFDQMPSIEVLADQSMGGAEGAFAAETNTIYLAESSVNAGLSDELMGIVGTIIEEMGHNVDFLVNPGNDTQGDEGALLKAAVLGYELTAAEQLEIQAEDDRGVVIVGGEAIAVEQNKIKGDKADNTLVGTHADDSIYGYGGKDTLEGLAGNDKLSGGGGNDHLDGGDGIDTINGGGGTDTVSYEASSEGVLLDLSKTSDNMSFAHTPNDLETVIKVENVVGGAGEDTLIGNASKNKFQGNAGADRLEGAGGNDQLFGGQQADKLWGGSGKDQLYGDSGNDTLMGDTGNDTLSGGEGHDILDGYGGDAKESDRLIGGAGADTFILGDEMGAYYTKNGNKDSATIVDLDLSTDRIQLPKLNDTVVSDTEAYGYRLVQKRGNMEVQGEGGDRIAILKGITDLSLTDDVFVFQSSIPDPFTKDLGVLSDIADYVDYAETNFLDGGHPNSATHTYTMRLDADRGVHFALRGLTSDATVRILNNQGQELRTRTATHTDDGYFFINAMAGDTEYTIEVSVVGDAQTDYTLVINPAKALSSWNVEYFNNKTLSGTPVRTETMEGTEFNLLWGAGSPGAGVNADQFSARFTGEFDFDGGYYNFATFADDGMRVYVDGIRVNDKWGAINPWERHDAFVLIPAGKHGITIEYFEEHHSAGINFESLKTPLMDGYDGPLRPIGFDGAGVNSTYPNTYVRNGSVDELGYPVNTVHPWENGYTQDFDGGAEGRGAIMKSNANNDSYWVGGPVWEKFLAVGGARMLGYPKTDAIDINGGLDNLDNSGGVVQHFSGNQGLPTKIWVSKNGAHLTYGAIGGNYEKLGGADSFLGFPISSEKVMGDRWVQQDFENGYMRWHPNHGTSIYDKAALDRTAPNQWKAEYFNSNDPGQYPIMARTLGDSSENLVMGWGHDSPSVVVRNENFSARFTTTRYFEPGWHKITAGADDGIRITVDNQHILSRWGYQPLRTDSGFFYSEGGEYPVAVEYQDNKLSSGLNVEFSMEEPPTGEGVFSDRLYQTVRGSISNHLYIRSSEDGTTWSDWKPDHSGRTLSPPNLEVFKNTLYQSVRGSDNQIYLRSSVDGNNWTSWNAIGGETLSAPDMEVFNGKLYMTVHGTDNQVYLRSSTDGQTWGEWKEFGGETMSSPELEVFNGKLYQTVRGTDNHIYTRSSVDGETWSHWAEDGGTTTSGPDMEVFKGKLYQSVRGTDNSIHIRSSADGETWTNWQQQKGRTTDSPMMSVFNDRIYQTVIGTDKGIYMRSSSDGERWTDWEATGGASAGELDVNGEARREDVPTIAYEDISRKLPADWHIKATGDFDNDGQGADDLLLRHDNGTVGIWTMNGLQYVADNALDIPLASNWSIEGTGDFNGDGKTDILVQRDDGLLHTWFMDGSKRIGFATFLQDGGHLHFNDAWDVVGTGDFDKDGQKNDDLLLQNKESGRILALMMNGIHVDVANSKVIEAIDPAWTIKGTGDFNKDGMTDILWQSPEGRPITWLMDGTTRIGGGDLRPGERDPLPGWSIQSTGDFNSDGITDILWHNDDGSLDTWLINGTKPVSPPQPQTSSNTYQLPYPDGVTYRVTAGNDGHHQSPALIKHNGYAWDFAMPEGSTIVASRAGHVISLYEGSHTTLSSPDGWLTYTNYVLIDHGDGSSSLYAHLQQNGVFPEIGDWVAQNQPIAKSGNTGYSTGPHLHYSVQKTPTVQINYGNQSGGYWQESLPSQFSDADVLRQNPDGIPVRGRTYRS